MKTKFFLIFLLITIIGCNNKKSKIESAILKTANNYPTILNKNLKSWKLIRSVKNGKFNFEIQLFEDNDAKEDAQKILVFINQKNECVAIPFFSNTHRNYWEFKNEKKNNKTKKTNTTFTNEYTKALNKIELNKSLIFGAVTNELIYSVLNCKEIKEKDDTPLNVIFTNQNSNLENEDEITTLNRLKLNHIEMRKTITDCNDCNRVYAYLDDKNFRIYQFIFTENKQTKSQDLIIKSFRQDQIKKYIYL